MLLAMRVGRHSAATVTTWALLGATAFVTYRVFSDAQPNYLVVGGLIAAMLATLQLWSQATTRKGQFVSEYVTKFYLDNTLWGTYNELIYCYTDKRFDEVDEEAIQSGSIAKAKERIEGKEDHEAAVDKETSSKGGPSDGDVRYHPWLFQLSEEESRLDALFGYLRVVDYYCAQGIIGTGAVYRQLGTFLLTMERRSVVQDYIKVNDFAWRSRRYRRKMGVDSPVRAVKDLLDCVKAYDEIMKVTRVSTLWSEEE